MLCLGLYSTSGGCPEGMLLTSALLCTPRWTAGRPCCPVFCCCHAMWEVLCNNETQLQLAPGCCGSCNCIRQVLVSARSGTTHPHVHRGLPACFSVLRNPGVCLATAVARQLSRPMCTHAYVTEPWSRLIALRARGVGECRFDTDALSPHNTVKVLVVPWHLTHAGMTFPRAGCMTFPPCMRYVLPADAKMPNACQLAWRCMGS